MSLASLVTLTKISKRYGTQTLFSEVSLSVHEGDRLGLIGPNGKGKSTLLKIIAGEEEPDEGTVTKRRNLRVVHIAQSPNFNESKTAFEIVNASAQTFAHSDAEVLRLAHQSLARAGIEDVQTQVRTMSGGQRKKLQIACGLSMEPELLLLDEPTNHLDITSIELLENLLVKSSFAWIAVSHDRVFLENTARSVAEVNPKYPQGIFVCEGNYSDYKRRSSDFMIEEQSRRESLENKVRTEQAWLRQGARARSTKAKGRTDQAYALIDELNELATRQREKKVSLEFVSSERETKKLIEFINVKMNFGEKEILSGFNFKLMAGHALGVLGKNGSGKSTFVKILAKELLPTSGNVKHAAMLEIAHFHQIDKSINERTTLKEVFSEDTDTVVYQGKEVHVTTWAGRFGFSFSQLSQPYGSLSGGEKARARLGKIMLETPDVLILDEPTNDLDIPTLEMLEQSLADFSGAIVLVTHDRYMINRLCNIFVGLDGKGGVSVISDYGQWEREQKKTAPSEKTVQERVEKPKQPAKRLSYKDQRDFDSIEDRIREAEIKVAEIERQLAESTPETNVASLQALCLELAEKRTEVESLFKRWEELEQLVQALSK